VPIHAVFPLDIYRDHLVLDGETAGSNKQTNKQTNKQINKQTKADGGSCLRVGENTIHYNYKLLHYTPWVERNGWEGEGGGGVPLQDRL
jgi:hypothetical protein